MRHTCDSACSFWSTFASLQCCFVDAVLCVREIAVEGADAHIHQGLVAVLRCDLCDHGVERGEVFGHCDVFDTALEWELVIKGIG
jgi:hypothetical protein